MSCTRALDSECTAAAALVPATQRHVVCVDGWMVPIVVYGNHDCPRLSLSKGKQGQVCKCIQTENERWATCVGRAVAYEGERVVARELIDPGARVRILRRQHTLTSATRT